MTQGTPIFCYKDKQSDSGEKQEAWAAEKRSMYQATCPFCNCACQEFYDETSYDTAEEHQTLAVCMRCGWWSYQLLQAPDPNGEAYFLSAKAIMKQFFVDDRDVPTVELSRYLAKNPEKIGRIDPAKFEALVADIYRDVLGCNIEACSYGRPDLGVDVVALHMDSGETLAIQVKRYNRPIELGQIHQFAGAMLDGGYSRGTFVTSGRYRTGAEKTAARLSESGTIEIDLVDGKKFLEFLALLNKKHNYVECPYWLKMGYRSNFTSGDTRIPLE